MAIRVCIQCQEHFEGNEGYGPYCSQMCREEAKNTPGTGPNGHNKTNKGNDKGDDEDEDEKFLSSLLPEHREPARIWLDTGRFTR